MIKLVSILFDLLFTILSSLFVGFIDLLTLIFDNRKTEYDAKFISPFEVMSSWGKGFCLTGKRSLSVEESFANALVLGGSSSGKSSRVLIPSILKMDSSSLIIHDPSQELFLKTSKALANEGYIIKVINYSKPELSEGFNPLSRIKSASDIQKTCQMLVHHTLGGAKNDPFWTTSASGLLSLLTEYVVFHCEPEYRNFFNVSFILNMFTSSPEKIDKLIVRTHDENLITAYKAFVAYDSKVLLGIIASARAALSIWNDASIAKVTSFDSIDFCEFRKNKTVLYINNSVKDMRYYSIISSIFFEQFWGEIMDRLPAKNELPIFFLLDESSSLFLRSLPVTVSNIRKYRSGIMQVYQDYNQLIDLYGNAQARSVASNCYAKVYMSGQPLDISKELSATLGKFQFEDENNQQRIRNLLEPDEVRQLNESIILIGNKPAIKAKMFPFFKNYFLNSLTELPPYELSNKLPFENPPLIPLNDEKA